MQRPSSDANHAVLLPWAVEKKTANFLDGYIGSPINFLIFVGCTNPRAEGLFRSDYLRVTSPSLVNKSGEVRLQSIRREPALSILDSARLIINHALNSSTGKVTGSFASDLSEELKKNLNAYGVTPETGNLRVNWPADLELFARAVLDRDEAVISAVTNYQYALRYRVN